MQQRRSAASHCSFIRKRIPGLLLEIERTLEAMVSPGFRLLLLSGHPPGHYYRTIRNRSKRTLLRLSAALFVLAAVAFAFSPARWMSVVEGCVALFLFVASFRVED